MSSLPSISSTIPRQKEYQVFLSFSGKDTRLKFTDHLYDALWRSKIVTFRDDPKLEAGEEISPGLMKAIQQSWCSVIVFSENYVFSSWCLEELAEIVKQKKENGHKVFPIFYGVDPSDLRKQKGKVEAAFAKHEERYKEDEAKIQRWRNALTEVANIKGWHSNNRHESELIGDIVKNISAKLCQTYPQWTGQVLSTTRLSGEGTKASMEEIWKCLMDDEVGKIGVWGMGGVGKTSIMKCINNLLVEEMGRFSIVIWTTVSKEMSIAKLQKDMASKIGVRFCGDEDEIRRAGMLFEALSRKRRFVIILDDLWQEVPLYQVGIPEPFTGSKLVLTTRSFDVCRKMSCRAITVKPLMEEESWKLFSEKVGRGILNIPEVEPIAKKIAKRCRGLPLSVITVASSMKDIDGLVEWRTALKELNERKQSINVLEDEVFQQLQFSYIRLKDRKLQHCFLSCALYPEDWEIEERELVRLWIAEGLVEEMDSRQAEFDRGRAIMNKLLNNCLLEVFFETKDGRCVKMHNLIRDMALHITSAKPRFFVKAGMGLREPPNVQEWSEDLEKVSLMRNLELQVLYPLEMSPPRCPMLTKLSLAGSGIQSIPERFFSHMDGLKVLDLSWNHIESLPNSISNLKNLTALLLANCFGLKYVPSLSNLRALKELDLERTAIKEVPHGMQNLSSLKCLNLDFTNVDEIPNGIFPRPSCLQELNVGEAFISGKKVGELKKLEIFEGRFYDLPNLNMYLQAFHGREEPRQYIIIVGNREREWEIHTSKRIELWDCDSYPNQIMLPRHIEELYVMHCTFYGHEEDPIISRFVLTSLGTFSSLKYLVIWNLKNRKRLFSPNCVPLNLQVLEIWKCMQLEEIIASEESGRVTMEFCLPRLKEIVLKNLPELKSICNVDTVMDCESLEWLVAHHCPKLKRMPLKLPQIRSSSSLKLFINLEPMELWESMEWADPDAKFLLIQKL